MTRLKALRNYMLLLLVFSFGATTALHAQPAWARGEQLLPIDLPEAMRRADAALRAEGYVNIFNQANVIAGYKGPNTAVFMCNQAPDGKQWINIVVSTITFGGGPVPDEERVKLQARMNGGGGQVVAEPGNGGAVDWSASPGDHRGQNGQRFTYTCPANGYVGGRAYGTDVYTDDSSICTCAVHAGLITHASGGMVTIEIRPGADAYMGTSRNGVASVNWGTWPGSFVIVR